MNHLPLELIALILRYTSISSLKALLGFKRLKPLIYQEIVRRPFRMVYYCKWEDYISWEESDSDEEEEELPSHAESSAVKYTRAEELAHYGGYYMSHKSGQIDKVAVSSKSTFSIPSGRCYPRSCCFNHHYLYLTPLHELFYQLGAHVRLLRSDVLHLSYDNNRGDLVVITLSGKIYLTTNVCLDFPQWTEVLLKIEYEIREIKLYQLECCYLMVLGIDGILRVYNLSSFTLEKEISDTMAPFVYNNPSHDNPSHDGLCLGYIKRGTSESVIIIHCQNEINCTEAIVPFLDGIILLDIVSTPVRGFHPEHFARADHNLNYVCLEFSDE